MLELKKTHSNMFNEYYEGVAVSGAKVTCILDNYCVRYMTFDKYGKRTGRREYGNTDKSKALCFQRATEALGRI